MKRFSYLFIIFFFIQSFCLFADEGIEPFGNDPLDISGRKKSLDIEDRSIEVGLAHLNVNFANNFLTISEVFQDVIVIDIDKLADGFMFNLGLSVTPFYFTYTTKKGWGFGLSTGIEGIGILGLSGNMLTISETVRDNSDISGALFASATIKTFFNVQQFKVKVNPSLYYTLAYITPSPKSPASLIYTLDYSNGTVMCVDYDMRIYTGFPLDSDDGFSLTAKPGLDFSVGVEYPLAKEIGLSKKFPFLDFDVSLDLVNVPFIPSTMSDYKQVKGRIGSDKSISFFGDDDEGGDFFSSFGTTDESENGQDEINVSRPFKMIASANWRPINGKRLLTITPVIGFCHNDLYYQPFSLELGINACLNLSNFFLVKAGINYTDRLYINSLGIAFNLRAFELDIGADLRSQTFAQSWTGMGLGLNFGLKFGW
jgi:hypothetical protein